MAFVFFAFELLRSDLTAIAAMVLLVATGVLSSEEAIRGFSNPATLTIACMFIISSVFVKTGFLEIARSTLLRWRNPAPTSVTIAIMGVTGFISAFINNTAAVAVFIPIVVKFAEKLKVSRKSLLMPLSYAAIFGGTCTLIGTSTNLIVNSFYVSSGFDGFTMFEFAPVGLILAAVGGVYMASIGSFLLHRERDDDGELSTAKYLTEVALSEESRSVGHPLDKSPFFLDFEDNIISMKRDGKTIAQALSKSIELKAGDRFILLCDINKVLELRARHGVSVLESPIDEEERPKDLEVFEVVVPFNSELIGQQFKYRGLIREHGIIPLAIRHRKIPFFQFIRRTRIQAGDVLVVAAKPEVFERPQSAEQLLVLSQNPDKKVQWKKLLFALSLVVGLVVLSGLGIIDILSGALVVCGLLLVTNTLSLNEAYEALDTEVLVLLSCMLSLGLALQKTGGAALIADFLNVSLGGYGPYVVLSVLYLTTSLVTEVISNSATAALMAPIALNVAANSNFDEKPFLVAVMLAGSASFMTPVGYQTNILIFAPGRFKFSDFLKIGTPLNLIFWLIATFLIPIFFPF